MGRGNRLKSDSLFMGIVVGVIIPVIVFGILYGVGQVLDFYSGQTEVLKYKTIGLVSIFSNMLGLRYYLVKLKYDKTGRGILMITFVFALIYFGFYI